MGKQEYGRITKDDYTEVKIKREENERKRNKEGMRRGRREENRKRMREAKDKNSNVRKK